MVSEKRKIVSNDARVFTLDIQDELFCRCWGMRRNKRLNPSCSWVTSDKMSTNKGPLLKNGKHPHPSWKLPMNIGDMGLIISVLLYIRSKMSGAFLVRRNNKEGEILNATKKIKVSTMVEWEQLKNETTHNVIKGKLERCVITLNDEVQYSYCTDFRRKEYFTS